MGSLPEAAAVYLEAVSIEELQAARCISDKGTSSQIMAGVQHKSWMRLRPCRRGHPTAREPSFTLASGQRWTRHWHVSHSPVGFGANSCQRRAWRALTETDLDRAPVDTLEDTHAPKACDLIRALAWLGPQEMDDPPTLSRKQPSPPCSTLLLMRATKSRSNSRVPRRSKWRSRSPAEGAIDARFQCDIEGGAPRP